MCSRQAFYTISYDHSPHTYILCGQSVRTTTPLWPDVFSAILRASYSVELFACFRFVVVWFGFGEEFSQGLVYIPIF